VAADDTLMRLAQLQDTLYAAGQTNLAVEVSELAGAFMVSDLTYQVRTDVGTLRRLRSGNTNLIELLEDSLDWSLVSLSHFELGPRQIKALEAAKQYRLKFPRKTENPELDAEVARALALSGSNKH